MRGSVENLRWAWYSKPLNWTLGKVEAGISVQGHPWLHSKIEARLSSWITRDSLKKKKKVICLFIVFETWSLSSPCCPKTPYVDQASLKLKAFAGVSVNPMQRLTDNFGNWFFLPRCGLNDGAYLQSWTIFPAQRTCTKGKKGEREGRSDSMGFNHRTLEAEAGGFLSLRSAWAKQQILCQRGCIVKSCLKYSKTL